MMRHALSIGLVLAFVSSVHAADAQELEQRLKAVEKERDDLRRELALAKLKIATLEDKLAAAGGGAKTGGDAKAPAGTAETAAGGEDDVDDAGVSKTSNTWGLKVISSTPQNANQLDGEIAKLQSELLVARSEITAGKKRLDGMRADNAKYDREYERRKDLGFAVGTKKLPFSDGVIGEARLAVQKAETKERVASRRILGLEREKAEAAKTLVITCESLQDGTIWRVVAKGGAYALGESMQPGRKYVIEGKKSGADTIQLTKINAAASE